MVWSICAVGMKSGTTNVTAFTLPLGYRPSIAQHFVVRVPSGAAQGNIVVKADGTVTSSVLTAGWDVTFTSLNGIVFDADGAS